MENKLMLSIVSDSKKTEKIHEDNITFEQESFGGTATAPRRVAEIYLENLIKRGFCVLPNNSILLYKDVLYVEFK
jgi:hypothetical protein